MESNTVMMVIFAVLAIVLVLVLIRFVFWETFGGQASAAPEGSISR